VIIPPLFMLDPQHSGETTLCVVTAREDVFPMDVWCPPWPLRGPIFPSKTFQVHYLSWPAQGTNTHSPTRVSF
jgi:hypothetical protein